MTVEDIGNALRGILTVIAVGVPALLILLGFFATIGGFGVQMITGDVSMKNFGEGLIIAGILLYIFELILYYWWSQHN
jgi:hypothetical protein